MGKTENAREGECLWIKCILYYLFIVHSESIEHDHLTTETKEEKNETNWRETPKVTMLMSIKKAFILFNREKSLLVKSFSFE